MNGSDTSRGFLLGFLGVAIFALTLPITLFAVAAATAPYTASDSLSPGRAPPIC